MGYGGAEIVCADLVCAMARQGHEVTVFAFEESDNELTATIQAAGVNLKFGAGKVNSAAAWRSLFGLLRSQRFDVIHCHLFPALYSAPLIKALQKCRLVYTEHSPGNRRRDYRTVRLVEKGIYSFYDAVVGVSDHVSRALLEWQPGIGGKLRMIHNGVDFERFRRADPVRRGELNIPDDAIVLVEVGAFRIEKNQQLAIRALAGLDQRYWLLLIGAGEQMEPCKALAASLGVADRVVFCGVRHDVEKLLKASDIYVQTASHFEGFCIAAFEAAASGLPVIYPEIDGLALLKSFGRPYQPGSQAELTAAIGEVSGDAAVQRELVRKGTDAANRMSVEFTRGEYARLYEELLDTARAAERRTES